MRWLDVLSEPRGYFWHGVDSSDLFAVLDSNNMRTKSSKADIGAAWATVFENIRAVHGTVPSLPNAPAALLMGSRVWDTTAILNRRTRTEAQMCNVTFGPITALALYAHRLRELLKTVIGIRRTSWPKTHVVWMHGPGGGQHGIKPRDRLI